MPPLLVHSRHCHVDTCFGKLGRWIEMVLLDKLYGLQYPLNILPTYALVLTGLFELFCRQLRKALPPSCSDSLEPESL